MSDIFYRLTRTSNLCFAIIYPQDPNLRLGAVQLILQVCGLPGSSAFAVCNTNVITSVGACLLKICHEQVDCIVLLS